MIILMGVSGAGKGTQSQLLANVLGYTILATGDMIRSFATSDQQAKIKKGDLLSDKEMIDLFQGVLHSQTNPNAVILDGFPRTLFQAEWLRSDAKSNHYGVEAVLDLHVPVSVILDRLEHRARYDDTPQAIQTRMKWYTENVAILKRFYDEQAVPVFTIDGNQGPDVVHAAIVESLKSINIIH